eukprot:scaffold363756_cov22-Prasinocladus_malaysianus.AAC.1
MAELLFLKQTGYVLIYAANEKQKSTIPQRPECRRVCRCSTSALIKCLKKDSSLWQNKFSSVRCSTSLKLDRGAFVTRNNFSGERAYRTWIDR